jgi:membrane-associated phospholipid phosphatase
MKHYIFIDYATQGYIALVGLLILIFHNETMLHWPWLVAVHGICLIAVHGLIRAHAARPEQRLLNFLRHFYPVLLYTGFYRETGEVNRMFVADYLDTHFIVLDQRLFGFQPCIRFMQAYPYLLLSEVFYAAYFSYYIMIAGVGLALFLRNRRQFYHYVSVVSLVFYVCYLTYIILPVMGPRAFFRVLDGYRLPEDMMALAGDVSYPEPVQAGPFYQIMAWIYRTFEGPGAAFPSSHVAIAIVTVWFSFLYLRPIRWIHFVVAVLLCLSTIYCRYHYVVDTLAGVLAAALLIPLANRLYRKYGVRTG